MSKEKDMIINRSRLVPKHTHWMSRLTFFTGILIAGNTIAQDMTYVAPDVTIFDSQNKYLNYLVLVNTLVQKKSENIISIT